MDEPTKKTMTDALRKLVEDQHIRRASNWNSFVEISAAALIGALLILLVGRGVRYVLANE